MDDPTNKGLADLTRELADANRSLRDIVELLAERSPRQATDPRGERSALPPPKRAKIEGKGRYCSFCAKEQAEVDHLIAGPGVYICDECVDLCAEIIEEKDRLAPDT